VVDEATAVQVSEPNRFVECVIAPDFAPAALQTLTTRPTWKKSVRLLRTGPLGERARRTPGLDYRRVDGEAEDRGQVVVAVLGEILDRHLVGFLLGGHEQDGLVGVAVGRGQGVARLDGRAVPLEVVEDHPQSSPSAACRAKPPRFRTCRGPATR
jgi:hypothetical protein